MDLKEWWQVVDMGESYAKKYVEEGPPEATMAKKRDGYIEFLQERKEKMGDRYTRPEMDKWNDEFHFDRKIGQILSYRKWLPENTNWATIVDENGKEKADKRKLQEPVLSRWKTVGDAAAEVSKSFLPLFFTVQKVINNHGSKMSGLIAAAAMSFKLFRVSRSSKVSDALCLGTDCSQILSKSASASLIT